MLAVISALVMFLSQDPLLVADVVERLDPCRTIPACRADRPAVAGRCAGGIPVALPGLRPALRAHPGVPGGCAARSQRSRWRLAPTVG